MHNKIPQYLQAKRNELIWALSQQDEYSEADIGKIFNRDRSTINRIVDSMPKGWKSKWEKVR